MTDHVLLFSYGTLQYPEVQKASFGRLLEGTDDAILGFLHSGNLGKIQRQSG
ncbi:hypothetical protein [Neorhizobium alkalisoli]|uniref:AIG2 family protein n=1 Tax=Neorhizobium alkalisoli TaxID=528178 RepID=A0A561Q877_9HYPH|nr:hypothetical protein [Neorhizobium alkalisoli]TWF46555.1 hypothetical protein FHW37_114124 [Neorhizobium alkalisoli]